MNYDYRSMEHDGYTRGVAFIGVGGLEKLQVASQLTVVEMRAYISLVFVFIPC